MLRVPEDYVLGQFIEEETTMNVLFRMFAAVSMLCLFSISAFGDSSSAESLKGLDRVYVQIDASSLPQDLREKLASIVNLELRKSGLRVADNRDELDKNKDGVVVIKFTQITRVLSQDLSVEWDVLQMAMLQRTRETLPVLTWRHDEAKSNVLARDVAESMLRKSMDTFLNDWLAANGR
ncbi:MAG: hypothetical protein ABUS47_14765 [Steroidobacter sp.]